MADAREFELVEWQQFYHRRIMMGETAAEAKEAWERCEKVLVVDKDRKGSTLMAKAPCGRKRLQHNDPE